MPDSGFELAALYAAIDAQRRERALTWDQAMLEINLGVETGSGRHPVARSTVAGLRTKRVAEADGVLQMLRWLGRSPESFLAGCDPLPAHELPVAPRERVLRFDTAKLHAAVNSARQARGWTWEQVARDIGGTSAAGLTHLKKGGRIGFPGVLRLTRWLGRPAADFVRIAAR